MISGKPGKYCKISVYLEHNAPSLYQNINDLCLFGALNTRRGRGVTFIIPDKKTQEVINNATNGKNPEDAVNMIKNLIVPMYLENPNDYMKEYTPTSNKGTALDIKSVSSKEVTLSNGTKITKIPSYIKLHSESKQSVMQASGDVVVQDMPSDFETKQGGYFTGGEVRTTSIIEKNYYQIKCFIKSHIKFSDRSPDPDPLTNYLCVYKEEPLVKCTFNGSPLSALFLYPLVESNFSLEHKASDMKSLFDFKGPCDIKQEKIARAQAVNKEANAANILGKIRERYDACWNQCEDIHDYFNKDNEAFINWSMAKDEFCLLHTESYIDAIKNKDEKQFIKIFHCFENYVCPGLISKEDYKECLHLTAGSKTSLHDIANIPLFCRRIELLISSVSFCGCSMGEILTDNSFTKDTLKPSQLQFSSRILHLCKDYYDEWCGCYEN